MHDLKQKTRDIQASLFKWKKDCNQEFMFRGISYLGMWESLFFARSPATHTINAKMKAEVIRYDEIIAQKEALESEIHGMQRRARRAILS